MKPALFKWGVLEARQMVTDDVPPVVKLVLPVRTSKADIEKCKKEHPYTMVGVATFREYAFKMTGYRNGLPLYEADVE